MKILLVLLIGLWIMPVQAGQLRLAVTPAKSFLQAEQRQTVMVKISLQGLPLPDEAQRTPLNLALVLDRSGSMQGRKIRQAREAAVKALDYLDRRDILAVVGYDDQITVLLPATKVTDKSALAEKIHGLSPGGSTALYAGIEQGAEEVRKFLSRERVNRIILLSDGLANVGPRSPHELGRLGKRLAGEGIAVTTLGLGLDYNEDLMTQLAQAADGSHAFIENAADLPRIFSLEFGDALSVVAQNIAVEIYCHADVRPLRVLGKETERHGRHISARFNQIYSKQEKYLLLEVEVPPAVAGTEQEIARMEVAYTDMSDQTRTRLDATGKVRFTASAEAVTESVDRKVMIDTATQIAAENTQEVIKLRDAGRTQEAQEKLKENAAMLAREAQKHDSLKLEEQSRRSAEAAEELMAPEDWTRSRKLLRGDEYSGRNMQTY